MNEFLQPDLVEIPGGSFRMGDVWGDGEPDELPVHEVSVKPFLLGKHAVTNREFLRFLQDVNSPGDEEGGLFIDIRNNNPIVFNEAGFGCKSGSENHPVTYVNWRGAGAYCGWLSRKTGLSFRLPSEAQWQYAAMGPDELKWSLGDTFNREDYVSGKDGPEPVDSGRPSAFGLYNVTGNVFEWCEDEYGFRLDCGDEANILKRNRVIKGGAFILRDSANFRNAKRFSCDQRSCLFSIGFRVAASDGSTSR